MKLQKNYLKWVVITVLLGAIGSGVWEYILKPIALGGTNFLLEVATLGVANFKDSLYEEIALGHHELPSLSLLSFTFGFLPGIMVGILLIAVILRPMVNVIRGAVTNDDKQRLKRRVFLLTGLFTLFLFTFSLVYVSRVGYINRAITHFNQLLATSGPYLNQDERLNYISKFTQVRNREEFAQVIEDLSRICKQNKQKTPKFSIW